jgi:hypothetical protein
MYQKANKFDEYMAQKLTKNMNEIPSCNFLAAI